jgi:hypothetical protein
LINCRFVSSLFVGHTSSQQDFGRGVLRHFAVADFLVMRPQSVNHVADNVRPASIHMVGQQVAGRVLADNSLDRIKR